MNDNAYQRIPPSSTLPALTSVLVDAAPRRRAQTNEGRFDFWKAWRRHGGFTINVDWLMRMRLRWRTVAKILGGILFIKVGLSIIGAIASSDGAVGPDYMPVPDGAQLPRSALMGNDSFGAENVTEPPPPPPPPIPPPTEAILCDNLREHEHKVLLPPELDEWQTIQLGISFGYSAFYDDRLSGVITIRVMGLADEWLDARPPVCQLWFKERVEPFALPANITIFPAQPTARYKSVIYTCSYSIADPEMPPPYAISMASEPCVVPLNAFKMNLLDRSTPPESRNKFSVCLASPMRLNFSEPGEMVDWLEIHKIFGVTHFVVYEHDVSPVMRPFLDYYHDRGEMDIYRWRLPPAIRDPRESVKAFGQLTMINDCLYRSMYKSTYLVLLDLDEMMVPRGTSKTLEEVLVTTSCQDKAQTIIRSAFFRKQWTNDEKFASDERMVQRSLVSLLKTKRERKVLAINVHAKYIVIPELIQSLEALAAMKFLPTVVNTTGEATCVLLAKECLLHHYRYYEEFTGDWMVDRKLHEFTKLIMERTGAVHEAVTAIIRDRITVAPPTEAPPDVPAEEEDVPPDVINTESEEAAPPASEEALPPEGAADESVQSLPVQDSAAADPGLAGAADPGLAGAADPGLAGAADPGLAGAADPGLAGAVDPGLAGAADLGAADLGDANLGDADLGAADLGAADLGAADLGESAANESVAVPDDLSSVDVMDGSDVIAPSDAAQEPPPADGAPAV